MKDKIYNELLKCIMLDKASINRDSNNQLLQKKKDIFYEENKYYFVKLNINALRFNRSILVNLNKGTAPVVELNVIYIKSIANGLFNIDAYAYDEATSSYTMMFGVGS